MGYFILPLLIAIAVAPMPQPSETTLANFSRFSRTTGTRISLVERDGTVREGKVSAATADTVTIAFGIGERTFPKTEIVSAERLRDSSKDGAIRGALFGAIMGILASQGYSSSEDATKGWFASVAIYTGIGWALDAAATNRQLIYRVPGATAASKSAVRMSLRFGGQRHQFAGDRELRRGAPTAAREIREFDGAAALRRRAGTEFDHRTERRRIVNVHVGRLPGT